jgi:hypothetical protein
MLYLIAENFCSSTHTLVQPPPASCVKMRMPSPAARLMKPSTADTLVTLRSHPVAVQGLHLKASFETRFSLHRLEG